MQLVELTSGNWNPDWLVPAFRRRKSFRKWELDQGSIHADYSPIGGPKIFICSTPYGMARKAAAFRATIDLAQSKEDLDSIKEMLGRDRSFGSGYRRRLLKYWYKAVLDLPNRIHRATDEYFTNRILEMRSAEESRQILAELTRNTVLDLRTRENLLYNLYNYTEALNG